MRPIYFPLVAALALFPGCGGLKYKGANGKAEPEAVSPADWPFKPVSMRVHPFTTLLVDRDTGELMLDARVELLDATGDVTKGLGKFRFELYSGARTESREGEERRLYVWESSAMTLDETRERYDPITRTYTFKLRLDGPPPKGRKLRLAVQFDADWNERWTAEAEVQPLKE